jgi:hypothetical protein
VLIGHGEFELTAVRLRNLERLAHVHGRNTHRKVCSKPGAGTAHSTVRRYARVRKTAGLPMQRITRIV